MTIYIMMVIVTINPKIEIMKTTGAWNSDDATWTFANRSRVEEDGG